MQWAKVFGPKSSGRPSKIEVEFRKRFISSGVIVADQSRKCEELLERGGEA